MKKILTLALVFFISISIQAQNISIQAADRHFELKAYSEAVDIYKILLKRDKDDIYLIQQIAYCYRLMDNYSEALKYYKALINQDDVSFEDRYNYGLLLLMEGEFIEVYDEFKELLSEYPNNQDLKDQITRLENFEMLNRFRILDSVFIADFNTPYADMCPAYFNDSIAFVSARKSFARSKYSWNNEPFLDIYQIENIKNGKAKISAIKELNSKYHEGALVFTNNENTVWFTRNSKPFYNSSGTLTQNLGIYKSDWDGKKWSKPVPFKYNSNEYSVGHPAFNNNEDVIYFTMNKEGGFGKTDIYKANRIVKLDESSEHVDEWSEPINLGSQINTSGNEMFPFVDDREVIFFSSDGFVNFGGFDIFAAYPKADTFIVKNLCFPINSTYDDFAFIARDSFSHGLFTSNRPGGVGGDDIYSFNVNDQYLFLNVLSKENNEPISNATIHQINGINKHYINSTNSMGQVSLFNDYQKDFIFEVAHQEYKPITEQLDAHEIFTLENHEITVYLERANTLKITTYNEEDGLPLSAVNVVLIYSEGKSEQLITDMNGTISLPLRTHGRLQITYFKDGFLSRIKYLRIPQFSNQDIETSMELSTIYEGKSFTLDNLYFDLNSSKIRQDATTILDNLYEIMLANPTLTIEISSHTDSRATDEYNLELSQQRAESVVEYIVEKGIDRSRLLPVGYGESQLLNHCKNGVPCSEEEHQLNRRIEFLILEM